MSKLTLGIVAGLIFEVLDVLVMIPLEFEDGRSAMVGAFVNRFSIGFVIGATDADRESDLSTSGRRRQKWLSINEGNRYGLS